MNRHTKDKKGRFTGSVGEGAHKIPPSMPIPAIDQDLGWGEQADLDALAAGWEQFRLSRGPISSRVDLDRGDESPDEYVGLRGSLADEEVEQFLSATDILVDDNSNRAIPPAPESIGLWEDFQPQIRTAMRSLDELEYVITNRLDNDNIEGLEDAKSGLTIYPIGGVRYTGWQHEELQTVLVGAIAAQDNGEGVGQQQVAAVISEYTSYATPNYYRVNELHRLGIAPGEFANEGQDARRLFVKGLEEEGSGQSPILKGAQLYAHRETISSALSQVSNIASRLAASEEPIPFREYLALRRRVSYIRGAVEGIKEAGKRQMLRSGTESVTTPSGGEYVIQPGRRNHSLNISEIRPQVIDRVSRDVRISRDSVEKIVTKFESVAHIASYRARALEKKTDIHLEDYLVVTQTPPRLVNQSNREGSV